MNPFDILLFICEKREEFEDMGLNAKAALVEAKSAVAEEYHISSASITRLVNS